MPLKNCRHLEFRITEICDFIQTYPHSDLTNKILPLLERDLYNYFLPHIENINALHRAKLITKNNDEFELKINKSIFIIPTNRIRDKLDGNMTRVSKDFSYNTFASTEARELIAVLDNEKTRLDQISKNARTLIKEIISMYGSYKYMLSQFPELNQILKLNLGDWKPNRNYSVPMRNSFNNCEAFVELFIEAKMLGGKT